jgi:hypothetical protein
MEIRSRGFIPEVSVDETSIPRRAGDDSVPDANASRSLRMEAPCLRAELYNEFYSHDQHIATCIETVHTIGYTIAEIGAGGDEIRCNVNLEMTRDLISGQILK